MSQASEAVRIALGENGKDYRLHRDCSGFTAWVARQVGVTIPEGSVAQINSGQKVADYLDEPGLLHFWDTYGAAPGHVALGIGGGKVIHAMNDQDDIKISSLRGNMGGNNRYMGARRIFSTKDPMSPGENPHPKDRRGHKKRRDRNRGRRP